MNDILLLNVMWFECRFVVMNVCIDDVLMLFVMLMNLDIIWFDLLLWFVWYFGVDVWKDYWFEYVKCVCVGQVILIVCCKGIVVLVCEVVVVFGGNIVLCEWFE